MAILRVLLCAAVLASAADWPQWRGPNRDGIVTAEPSSWPEKLNVKWKVTIGEGHSSPILAGGSIYAIARQGEQEVVMAVDPANGKVRWQQQYPAPYKMNSAATAHGPGPKSTPVYANGKLYTFGISGILSAFDAETGKPAWRLEFSKQYKDTAPDFGTSMSPVVDRGLVIAHVGGTKTGALAAFDANTGAMKWGWDGDSPAYASPIIVEVDGVRQVITQTHSNIVGVAEDDGKLLWKLPFTTSYDQNIVTPALYRDILIFSGLEKGVFGVNLTRKDSIWSAKTVWQTKDAGMYMNSPVVAGDLVFGFSHLKHGQLFCLDPRTGALLWTGSPRGGDNAAVVASASTLYSLNPEGELLIAKPTAKGLNEVRRYNVAESPTWAHPVILPDGVLIKDLKTLARWSVN